MRTRGGVLALKPEGRRWLLTPEQRQHLDTVAALAAIALVRVHYIKVAQNAPEIEEELLKEKILGTPKNLERPDNKEE